MTAPSDFRSADADLLEQIAALSRHVGSDPQLVLAGGGNTSAKTDDVVYVKMSGVALANIQPEGFVALDRAQLDALLDTPLPKDVDAREELFLRRTLRARLEPERNQRPSVECLIHHLIRAPLVVHTHPTLVNALTCSSGGQQLADRLFGDDIVWMPFVDPGLRLAHELAARLADYTHRTGRAMPEGILMQNHGLIVAGESADEVRTRSEKILSKIAGEISPARWTESPELHDNRNELVRRVAPALRGLLGTADALPVVTFETSQAVEDLVGSDRLEEIASAGPLTPDQIVYCKSFPMVADIDPDADTQTVVDSLRQTVDAYRSRCGFNPVITLIRGLGLFAAADSCKSARTAADVYVDAIGVMARADAAGGILPMSTRDREFIENWEIEAYRRKVSRGSDVGRARGKVALVTGAAQGFGLEIAQDLFAQGAHVVLTDINADGAKQAARKLATEDPTRTVGLAINVTDAASIRDAVTETVLRFGGLDVLISNAGVLKAESVKTQPEEDFDFVTAVNYKGYFLCVQNSVDVLATQHLANPDCWSDIIQINSKSGLAGSNKNFAYAGGKFGGIGLTQSFALELVDDGVKVNSVCPGNFYDGPLWSDPDNGLFVQYLQAGKVPGAKTIDDVRKAYEAKTPIHRGCTTPDVMKAIYYVMEQRFETGQAVPVTGGQEMLN